MIETLLDERAPKYLHVAAQLRREIADGVFTPGDRLPPYSEAQARYGTTKNTLDKAHALLERDGLIIRRNGAGIFVAEPVRGRDLTGIIGFTGAGEESFAGRRSSYWSPMVEGIQAAALQAGVEILLLHGESKIHPERVDGVLVNGSPQEILRRVPEGLPWVALLSDEAEGDCVVPDDFGGAKAAVLHLLELGHRSIAFLPMAWGTAAEQRIAGYKAALNSAGAAFNPRLIRSLKYDPHLGFTGSGEVNTRRWLEEDWAALAPTALFCHNDDTAVGAIKALNDAGLRVPRDLSVVGFDGLESGESARLHLTSARVPLKDIGFRGVELLLKKIHGHGGTAREVLPVPLQLGRTTQPVR